MFIGTEFQFCEMKKIVEMDGSDGLCNNGHVLHATELSLKFLVHLLKLKI